MGTKVAVMYAFMCVFGLVFQSLAVGVKWHSMRAMLGPVTLLKMETGLIYTRVETGSSILCRYQPSDNLKPGRCDELAQGITLQDAADEWCSPLMMSFMPQPCISFKTAYFCGLANLLAVGINVLCIMSCLFLIVQYLEGSLHKSLYRRSALIVHFIATVFVLGAFISYILLAIKALNEVSGQPQVIANIQSSGASFGLFLMGAGLLLQFAAGALLGSVRVGQEETQEEELLRKWGKEEAMYASLNQRYGYGYDAYGGHEKPYDQMEFGSYSYQGDQFQQMHQPETAYQGQAEMAYQGQDPALTSKIDLKDYGHTLRKQSIVMAVLKGGLCPMGKNPTGQPGCVYNYEPLVEKDYVNLEDLIQAVDGPLKCGSNGERTCENWNDWRRNCHDPEKKYKRKFQQAYLADGRMDVKIVETEHCRPARILELLTNNPKCATVCKPNTNGGPYCSRQFGGVCSQCYIPGTKDPFHDPEHFPTCPFDVLEEGGYSVPAGTECKSNRASDICCLYNVNGPCSKTFTDGSNIDLDMEGFLGVSKTAKEDPAQMLTFAKRWVEEEKGGKLNDEELFGKEVFRLWRIHPPKHPEEAWEFFQDSLKASKAVDYDAPTEEPPTPEPAGPGPPPSVPPAPPSPKPKPSEPGTNWSVIFAVLAAAALVMVFLFMYRDTRRRQAAARGSYMEEGDGRALQMSRM
ncbi:unnamed protein product [Effrenium voratum]|nr:unnamed protein product [Effrenium voratum]